MGVVDDPEVGSGLIRSGLLLSAFSTSEELSPPVMIAPPTAAISLALIVMRACASLDVAKTVRVMLERAPTWTSKVARTELDRNEALPPARAVCGSARRNVFKTLVEFCRKTINDRWMVVLSGLLLV